MNGTRKTPYTVTLTLQCGARQYVRSFNVDANDPADAVVRATWKVPHLPDSDPIHTDGVEGVDAGARIDVVAHDVARH